MPIMSQNPDALIRIAKGGCLDWTDVLWGTNLRNALLFTAFATLQGLSVIVQACLNVPQKSATSILPDNLSR